MLDRSEHTDDDFPISSGRILHVIARVPRGRFTTAESSKWTSPGKDREVVVMVDMRLNGQRWWEW